MGIMHVIGMVGRFLAEGVSDEIKGATGIDLMKSYDSVKRDYIKSKEASNDLEDLKENREEYEKLYGKEKYENVLKEAELERQDASEKLSSTFQATPKAWESTLKDKMEKNLSKLSDTQLKNIDTRKLPEWAEKLYDEERDKRGI